MKILRRYVAGRIFAATALVFAALLLLFGFFDFIQELGELGRGSYRLSPAGEAGLLHWAAVDGASVPNAAAPPPVTANRGMAVTDGAIG